MVIVTRAATIKHRFQTNKPNRASSDVSRNVWDDSEVIGPVGLASGESRNGHALVLDDGQTDGYGTVKILRTHYLGGSRGTSFALASGYLNAADWLDIELDGDEVGDLLVRARVECRVDAGEAVTPRVLNVTDATEAGVGVTCTATDADYSGTNQIQVITVTLASGAKKYRLQGFLASGVGGYAIGYLEIGGS